MTLYAYYVNGDFTEGKTHAIYTSYYDESIATWSPRTAIKINGIIDGNAVDPDLRLMSDGRLVLTYMRGQFGASNQESVATIYQAWSIDGVNFFDPQIVYKPTAITTLDPLPAVTDPSLVTLNNGSTLLAISSPAASNASFYTSTDGINFSALSIQLPTFSPDLQTLDNGNVRIFYTGPGGIASKTSSDNGLTWTNDPGFRVAGMYFDPSVFKGSDEKWYLLLKTQTTTTNTTNPLAGHSTSLAMSTDGITFTVVQQQFATAASVAEGVNFSPIRLFTAQGSAYQYPTTPKAFIKHTNGQYSLLFTDANTWTEQLFSAQGTMIEDSHVITATQLAEYEVLLNKDLNSDQTLGINPNANLYGTGGDDTLLGTIANEVFQAGSGNDRMLSNGGNDTLNGGTGVDTLVLGVTTEDVLRYPSQLLFTPGNLSQLASSLGVSMLSSVERVQLSDGLYAFDTLPPDANDPTGGKVWQVEALYQAYFGYAPSQTDLSRWLAIADNTANMAALGQKMLDYYAPATSAEATIRYLYKMLVGSEASATDVAYFAQMIGEGKSFATQGHLFAEVAASDINAHKLLGIVGSIQLLDPSYF